MPLSPQEIHGLANVMNSPGGAKTLANAVTAIEAISGGTEFPPNEVNTSIATVGNGVLTAAGIAGRVITRIGPVGAYTDTTDTAAAIIAAVTEWAAFGIGQASFEMTLINNTAFAQTWAAGAGVTLTIPIVVPANSSARLLVSYTGVNTVSIGLLWVHSTIGGLPSEIDNTVVTGTGTMVSGAMEGAEFVTLTASGQGAITLTTRTAAQIQANVPNWKVGKVYRLRIINNNTGTLTTAGGANVTMTSTIPAGYYADYAVTFATATTITVAQTTVAPTSIGVLPPAQFSTINVTTGTLGANKASGAEFTSLTSTNAVPGSQAMRTPAQILTDTPGLAIGQSYNLRITNTGAGTFTLATDSGAGFTMTGLMTVPVNTFSDFVVTISTATTGVVQQIGSGSAVTPLPDAKFTTINVTTGTLAAGNASGARFVNLMSTNATPGSQAMRTPAQILTDTPSLAIGQSYMLRVLNTGANPFTLATDSGAGFTMTGTMTVALNTWRDFIVTINSATTGTVQQMGTGTSS